MALTSVDTQKYLRLTSILSSLPKADFYTSYDAEADVMYINFHNPPKPADDTEHTDDDVLIRYDESGEVIGITILQASKR